MNTQIEQLKSWSHFLYWCSVILPLLGVGAGIVRFYIDRKEKTLSSAQSRASLEESRQELAKLKTLTAPRRLEERQIDAIASALTGKPPIQVTIMSRLLDGEGSDFASDIGKAFTRANWQVNHASTGLFDFQGVCVMRVGSAVPIPEAEQIVGALVAGEINVSTQDIPENKIGAGLLPGVGIFVGRR